MNLRIKLQKNESDIPRPNLKVWQLQTVVSLSRLLRTRNAKIFRNSSADLHETFESIE